MKRLPRSFEPAKYTSEDVVAVRKLFSDHREAFDWIINEACQTYEISYRPEDQGGATDTAFAEGRRFVGSQILKLAKISEPDLNRLRANERRSKTKGTNDA